MGYMAQSHGVSGGPSARCAVGFAEGNLESGVVTAVRAALAGLGTARPTLAIVTVCAPGDPDTGGRILGHASALLREVADGCAILGTNAHGVLAAEQAGELVPAITVWLASWPGPAPRPFRVHARPEPGDSFSVHGLPDLTDDARMVLLFADPWSTPVAEVLAGFDRIDGALPVIGGLASGGAEAGSTRLLLGSSVLDDGVVGVVLDQQAPVRAVVSQGCRPIGPAMVATSSRGGYVIEMAGQPSILRIRSVVADLDEADQALAARGLQMGIAHHADALGDSAADYVMRAIIGAEPVAGGITVADNVPTGSLLRLHLRDADSAHDDLCSVLEIAAQVAPPVGAFVVTCNGRGRSMFTTSAHDSSLLVRKFATDAVGGFFAAGEIGPIGGANHLHGFTAAVLIVDAAVSADAVEVTRQEVEDSGDGDLDQELVDLLNAADPFTSGESDLGR